MPLFLTKVGQAPLARALPILTQDVQKILPRMGRIFGIKSAPEKALIDALEQLRPQMGPRVGMRPVAPDVDEYLKGRLFQRQGLPEQTAQDRLYAALGLGGAGAAGGAYHLGTREPESGFPLGAQPAASPKYAESRKHTGLRPPPKTLTKKREKSEGEKRVERAHKARMKPWKKRERRQAKFRWQDQALHKRDSSKTTPFKLEDLPVEKPSGT